ncbi:MAG TPA: zinc ribbon domain-containing protein [Blastocatellia bacterium]|nr:zinc ribbon domain-containing protein [Blastocatellia bacterium]
MPTCGECKRTIPDGDRFCGNCGTPVRHTEERGAVICQFCGSTMRRGELFSDREVTAVLADPQEERFINLFVCRGCGQVRLFVDYETDVEQ